MAVKRAESNVKKASEKPKKQVNDVSLEDQLRLAEILNDTPHIVNLNGTKWEIRALRIGTQMLIAEVLSRFVDDGSENFGGVMKNIGKNIDAVVECITLGLLNDRMKIYDGGAKENGFSSLYHSTKETIRWDVDVSKLGGILVEMIQMIDISFFLRESGYFGCSQTEHFEEEGDEDKRTETIYSVSQIGSMVDFLKAFPFVSVEDYMWGLSAPMIELIAIDNTHVRYLSDKEAEMRSAKKITNETMRNDLGMPILVIDNDNNNDNNNKN